MRNRPLLPALALALALTACPAGGLDAPPSTAAGANPFAGADGTLGAPDVAWPPLAVTSASPRGEAGPVAEITVHFNQPMVALTDLDAQQAKTVLKIEPPLPGRHRWIDPTTLRFEPGDPLQQATTYRVTIPAGTASAVGGSLGAEYSFEFITERPEIRVFRTGDDPQRLRPDATFTLVFSQPIDRDQLAAAVELQARSAAGVQTLPVQLLPLRELTAAEEKAGLIDRPPLGARLKDWPLDQSLSVKPAAPLPLGAALTLTVKPFKGTRGAVPSLEAWTWTGATYGPLRIAPPSHNALRFNETLWLTFSNPVTKGAERHIRVTPAAPGSGVPPLTGPTPHAPLLGPWRPEQTYTVTISPDLTDIFGQKLGKVPAITFTVEPLRPQVALGWHNGALEASGHRTVWATYTGLEEVTWSLARLTADQLIPTTAHLDALAWEDDPFVGGVRPSVVKKGWRTGGSSTTQAAQPLPLDLLLPARSPGAVLAGVAYEGDGGTRHRRALFQITDIGLAAQHADNRLLVYAASLITGLPLPNARVELRNSRNAVLWTGQTDADGLAVAPGVDDIKADARTLPLWVIATSSEDLAWIQLKEGNVRYAWDINYTEPPRPTRTLDGTIYSDRGIYRPGDTVQLRGVLRGDDRRQPFPVDPKAYPEVLVTARDARSEPLVEQRPVRLSPFGTFTLELTLPPDAPLGEVSVEAVLAGPEPLGGAMIHGSFSVQAFRTPEFEVGLEPVAPDRMPGQALQATVRARYLFGAPMRGAATEWTISSAPAFFTPPPQDDATREQLLQSFTWHDSTWARSFVELGRGRAETGSDGALLIEAPAPVPNTEGPRNIAFGATVTDLNRQVISGQTHLTLHAGALNLGVRVTPYIAPVGKPLRAEVLALTTEGTPAGSAEVEVTWLRETWKSTPVVGSHWPRWARDWTPVHSCRIKTTAGAESCAYTPKESGYYVARASGKDGEGNVSRASAGAWVWGGRASWGNQSSLELIPERSLYKPGEVATILIKSPLPESRGLLTVERGGILSHAPLHLASNAEAITVPIPADGAPNLTVSVLVAKGRTASVLDPDGGDIGRPLLFTASAQLNVDTSPSRLQVELRAERAEARPGQTVQLQLRVTDAEGRPARAEVAVAAVDKGILNLLEYRHPDLLSLFWHARPASTALTALHPDVRPIPEKPTLLLAAATPRTPAEREAMFKATQEESMKQRSERRARISFESDMIVGGLKAPPPSAQGSAAAVETRSHFLDTALWAPTVTTGEDGLATVPLKLPDNLTTWTLMAVAVDPGVRFGVDEAELVVNKPLLLRPSLPRFANPGDLFDASVVVQNESGAEQVVEVAVADDHAPGNALAMADAAAPRARTVKIAAGKGAEVAFRVKALRPGEGSLRFTAIAGELNDGVVATTPVITPVTTEAVAAYGDTTEALAFPVRPPFEVRDDVGGLTLALSSTALSGLEESLQYLVHYPYGCLEQTISRAFPLMIMGDITRLFELKLPGGQDDAALRAMVRDAIGRVLSMQRYNGGFSTWPDTNPSHPWASTYAMHFLEEARRHDYAVPEEALERGWEYLRSVVDEQDDAEPEERRLDLAVRAYIAWVAHEAGRPMHEALLALLDALDQAPLFARAFALMALEDSPAVAGRRDATLQSLLNHVVETAADAHFEEPVAVDLERLWHSDNRTDAIGLLAVLKAAPESPLSAKLVRWLMKARKAGRWANTQENLWALLAMERYLRAREATPPDFEARAWLGERTALSARFEGRSTDVQHFDLSMAELTAGGPDASLLTLARQGQGRLYYTLRLTWAPTGANLKPRSEGFTLTRAWTPLDAPDAKAIPAEGALTLPAGIFVRVRLTLTVPERRHFVVIDDPLPAGMEAVNFSFATTDPALANTLQRRHAARGGAWEGHADPFDHKELRDERVLLFAEDLWPGVYLYDYIARTTTRGTFQVLPAKAEEMYAPETFGRTSSGVVVID